MDLGADRFRIPSLEWLDLFEQDYLNDFVVSGGATVKFLTGDTNTLENCNRSLELAAQRHGYYYIKLDPSVVDQNGRKPDLHRIDRFYFETAKNVDWRAWAEAEARKYLAQHHIHIADHQSINDLDAIAANNNTDASILLEQYRREFATPLIRDHSLSTEFRTALAALNRAQLVPDSMSPTTEEVLLGWLAGRTMPGASAALKKIHIFTRIDRSNARHMLASFCRWLPRTERSGLVVLLDFRPYERIRKTVAQRRKDTEARLKDAIARRAPHSELDTIVAEGEAEPPISYSSPAYLQMLQLLRRFIDEIDWFQRFCLIVYTTPEFCHTERPMGVERHYTDYDALQTRIGLEVHDVGRANPAASLVHLRDDS